MKDFVWAQKTAHAMLITVFATVRSMITSFMRLPATMRYSGLTGPIAMPSGKPICVATIRGFIAAS